PMKGTEFIDSITRLSSVEQAVNQTSALNRIEGLLGKNNSDLGSPVSYLGREIEFQSSSFNLVNGEASFYYNLADKADAVNIVITKESGETVFTSEGNKEIGKNKIVWDGTDINGNKLSGGRYIVAVSASNVGEKAKLLDTYTSGVVTEANFEGSETVLLVDKIVVGMDKIKAIRTVNSDG
ncbi:hypothetical protein N9W34_05045, partial [Rickettsiales bacterium]|nr:hypothetical protein [Rickettsiales bacterium]